MVSRRGVLLAAAAAGTLAGCGPARHSAPAASASASAVPSARPATSSTPPRVRLIGDGSTSDTGPQPHQPVARALGPGEEPPQFVVFSWDGSGRADLFTRFRELARELNGNMTFFLTGLYTLPKSKRMLYRPPRHPAGASALGWFSDKSVHGTIGQLGPAWLAGNEIGTHFNGHFCGPGGVERWSPSDWDSEIDQALSFVRSWRTNTGFTDIPPLPFDYGKELTGGRTPCLEGQKNLLKASRVQKWKYDSSGTGTQVWPKQWKNGLWQLPMQGIPFPGHSFEVISMDYNIMFNQSRTPHGDPARHAAWKAQARDAYLAGFRRAYDGNRAPLIIGNHFENWNRGIYMDAVTEAARAMAQHPNVRFVSFRQLVAWLEAQNDAVLQRLRALPVGRAPRGGWTGYLGGAA
ncbi:hypothetical protein [Paractinoplanes atraurantiacus]|uniref:Polysaccharide deacetylase n=1 Tax=Paractinoplanes atraurantiacus TaxID=1036182 RepID=A0A285JVQ3_9ACTN|nr:hypothetical protein [Actinoplanes atraurantiacus]SNY64399.1 hypothetical protein SAMN05421748_126128 [Actinoplanes atraurantiacus]